MRLEPHGEVLAPGAVDAEAYRHSVTSHRRKRRNSTCDQAARRGTMRDSRSPSRQPADLVLVHEDAVRNPGTVGRPSDALEPVDGLQAEMLEVPLLLGRLLGNVRR